MEVELVGTDSFNICKISKIFNLTCGKVPQFLIATNKQRAVKVFQSSTDGGLQGPKPLL